MATPPKQRLRVLPGSFVVEQMPAGAPEGDGWVAQVRAPEGLTVIRQATQQDTGERWIAVYGGEPAHGVDAPGMLAALLNPLAAAAIPVFVTSTFHADLVFVPQEHGKAALGALHAAGHLVARQTRR